ncbi:AAA+-type ATPase [Malassezia equina]|uniref:AAA+-type ATPase n=1 Tax=Malassezia equina TaxID=1381935 RepID=A0AAF0ED34_9BASI|nr:AAA+-type ATPase [Malassezia equina]
MGPLTALVREPSASLSVDTRLLVHSGALKEAQIPTGSHVLLTLASGAAGGAVAGTIWPDFDAPSGTVSLPALMAPRDMHEKAVAMTHVRDAPCATRVVLALTDTDESVPRELLRTVFLHTLRAVLVGTNYTLPCLGHTIRARVTQVHPDPDTHLVRITRETQVALDTQASTPTSLVDSSAYQALGGLDAQIAAIRTLVELPLTQPALFAHYGLSPPRGVLLYGPPGTGKTSLARTVAASLQAHVITIDGPELSSMYHGETESKLRAVFAAATMHERCIVFIDEIDALAPRRDASSFAQSDGAGEVERRVVATLLTLLDGMGTAEARTPRGTPSRVVVLAATNRPNALDPALRRPGRLDREIEVGVPDAAARQSILDVLLRPVPHALQPEDIRALAARTHGYVGADLAALVREAGLTTITRGLRAPLHEGLAALSLGDAPAPVTLADFTAAQAVVRPSAMREVFVETPKVTWADIADDETAMDSVKRQIQECVEGPLRHADAFARLGIDAPKGALLYGPPGCSKTLTAQALARESGLNFLTVRGPELLSKYVGESERAIREVFRRARTAAPSIVFFDEIDAISGTRSMEASHGSSDRIVASLLTEMDGIDAASHVVVVAATNRPDCIDPALLRPGRIDRLVYVGPPSVGVREKILAMRTRRMALADDVDLAAVAALATGCSGAEVVAICQEAGLRAITEDPTCAHIAQRHLVEAAQHMPRRITPTLLAQYEAWRQRMAR